MEIKSYDKQGLIAWSNSKAHSQLLASASLQQDQGLFFIDILSLDLQERSKKINVIGSGYTSEAFRCIAWDNFGQKQNSYQHGIIFTGMQNGSFKLWNPDDMIATYNTREVPSLENIENQTCILYEQDNADDGNNFPVMCAEWNSLKNNLLAFGSTDLLILDVGKDISDPEPFKPGKKNPHDGSYVTSVSWNREVAHILASASENGLVALWDIKANNSIFHFKDSGVASSSNRNVVICWSKSISTQIAVTLDDQKQNVLQIWDLRNQKGPVIVIDKRHSKGINSMDWCETDQELILAASRDNKVVCWNYTQEDEPLSETVLPTAAFDVKWSKKLPSIYSVSTDQKTSVYTLNDTNLFSYVPKWYKIPVGSTFLGNDAILTYSEQRGSVLHENRVPLSDEHSQIRVQLQVIKNVIDAKFDESENESQIASVLKAKAGGQNDNEIYDYLGFNKSKIVHEVEQYTGKKREFAIGGQKEKKSTKPKQKAYTQIQGQDALAFFQGIGSKQAEQANKTEEEDNSENIQYDMVPRNFNWDIGKEGLVKQNILIGNYQGAIDAALKCGRTAEALIIAYSVDQNLFKNTLKTFFTETTDNFITNVLKHIAIKDALELVKKYDLNKWKECVALIYSLASREKRSQLLSQLAERLRNQTDNGETEKVNEIIPESYAPIICYILAEDFTQIAKIYYENLNKFRSGTINRKLAVIEYARRLLSIYQNLTVEIANTKLFYRIIKQVAFIAIEQQQRTLAHSIFVKYLPNNYMRYIDYLINSGKELDQYKSSIGYKQVQLPVMQAKKAEKKTSKQPEHPQPVQKKKNIFPPKEEENRPPPKANNPPHVVKRKQEESEVGFSPYQQTDSAPKHTPANNFPPKKNLNTPPPPPPPVSVVQKKHQHVEEQQQPERQVSQPPPQKSHQPQPPARKNPPPPPSPPPQPTHNQSYEEEPNVKSHHPVKGPGKSLPPPPPPAIEKKSPPPPSQIPQKQSPPPPPPSYSKKQVVREQVQQDVQEEAEQVIHHQPPPQSSKRKMPPPPPAPARKISQPEEIPVKEEAPRRLPPPIKTEQTKQRNRPPPPPVKEERRRVEEPEADEEETVQVVRKNVGPLPPAKRGPPPPPPRR